MNLGKKKELAKRTFNVGKDRIIFVESRIDDIKEAITKQDMRDLKRDGAIVIINIGGRKTINRRSSRSTGNIRKVISSRKKDYMKLTRKLRKYAKEIQKTGKITREEFKDIRKKIRNKSFRSKAHLKEYVTELKK